MNKSFIKEKYNITADYLNDTEILKVIKFIMKLDHNDSVKRTLIQQFLLNWITVGVVSEK